jgi:hypothetical protein
MPKKSAKPKAKKRVARREPDDWAGGGRPKGGRARKPLPLDNPRWLPVEEIHKLLMQRTGDGRLAASDLNKKCGAVRCMCRRRMLPRKSRPVPAAGDVATSNIGDRELVAPAHWANHEFKFTMSGHLVLWRKGEKGAWLHGEFVFYLWKADVVKAWPGLLKSHATPEGKSEERRRRDPLPVKHAGGRPRSFTSRQIGELQEEQRRYENDHPGEPKKDVKQHVQNWAKDTLHITASLGTIRKSMRTAKNKN